MENRVGVGVGASCRHVFQLNDAVPHGTHPASTHTASTHLPVAVGGAGVVHHLLHPGVVKAPALGAQCRLVALQAARGGAKGTGVSGVSGDLVSTSVAAGQGLWCQRRPGAAAGRHWRWHRAPCARHSAPGTRPLPLTNRHSVQGRGPLCFRMVATLRVTVAPQPALGQSKDSISFPTLNLPSVCSGGGAGRTAAWLCAQQHCGALVVARWRSLKRTPMAYEQQRPPPHAIWQAAAVAAPRAGRQAATLAPFF